MGVTAETLMLDQVKNIIESTLRIPAEKLDVDADFEDFGIDSIIAMELISNLSEELNVSISPADFTQIETVRQLAELLEKLASNDDANEDDEEVTEQEPELPPVVEEIKEQNIVIREEKNKKTARSKRISLDKVIKHVYNEYSVDLSSKSFNSVDEIVNYLTENHSEKLKLKIDGVEDQKEIQSEQRSVSTNVNSVAPKKTQDVAIVGISCNFPDADNPVTFWDNLINRKNSIKEIPESRWNWKDYYVKKQAAGKTVSKWGALIDNVQNFDAKFFNVSSEEALLMDPQERLLLQEVYKALQDSGTNPEKLKGSNTGVFIAYEYSEYEHYLRNNIESVPVGPYGPFFSSSSPTYYLSNRISYLFDFHGPSESFNVNCAGSAVALNRAYYSLLNDETSIAAVCGASLNLFADDYIALSQYGMLSPDGTCGVFDDNANGFTRGEGLASVILKKLEDAERDNDRIYGVIKSSHQNNRGVAKFVSEIKHEAITDVLKKCYKKAGLDSESVRYIEVDGYATKWGDSFEFDGIRNTFKTNKNKDKYCALGSLKGNIGNLESVNGLASVIKIALALKNQVFPATISKKKTNSFIDIENSAHPLYIADKEINFEDIRNNSNVPIRAGLNSFADSGVNVHILLEEYKGKKNNKTEDEFKVPPIFLLSAKNTEQLIKYIEKFIDYLKDDADNDSFNNMLFTQQVGREVMDEKIAIISKNKTELLSKLRKMANKKANKISSFENDGIFYGNSSSGEKKSLMKVFTNEMLELLVKNCIASNEWNQLAQLWVNDLIIPWDIIWNGAKIEPVSLPTYPFDNDRYWLDIDNSNKQRVVNQKSDSVEEEVTVDENIEQEYFFYLSEDKEKDSRDINEKADLLLKQEISLQIKKKVDNIDITKNFLELGMNSIGIAAFISKVNSVLKVNISPSILFTNSDVEKLTQYLVSTFKERLEDLCITEDRSFFESMVVENGGELTSQKKLSPSDVVTAMQTKGKKRPIFVIPGANGTVHNMHQLITAMGNKQPIYGIESAALSGDISLLKSIEDIAKFNIEAIKTVQNKGPFKILGYSNGGIIAFAMAKALLEKGEKVESLILLDTPSPEIPHAEIENDIVEVFKSILKNSNGKELKLTTEEFKKIPEDKRCEFLNDLLRENGYDWPKEQFAASYDAIIAGEKCYRSYKPKAINKKLEVVLFKATEGYIEGYIDLPEDYGWNNLLKDPIQIIPIKANHISIVDKASGEVIANNIESLKTKIQ